MKTINYKDFSEQLSTLIEDLHHQDEPLYLELPDSLRVVILSEQNYENLTKTSYLPKNSVNIDNLQKPHPDLAGQVLIRGEIFDSIPEQDWDKLIGI